MTPELGSAPQGEVPTPQPSPASTQPSSGNRHKSFKCIYLHAQKRTRSRGKPATTGPTRRCRAQLSDLNQGGVMRPGTGKRKASEAVKQNKSVSMACSPNGAARLRGTDTSIVRHRLLSVKFKRPRSDLRGRVQCIYGCDYSKVMSNGAFSPMISSGFSFQALSSRFQGSSVATSTVMYSAVSASDHWTMTPASP